MKEKNISIRNYILLAFILILSVILVIYFYMWYGTYEKNKLNTPIMDKYLSVINYNEIEDYLIENKDSIIYVSILNDDEIRNFEKKFKSIINLNSLNNSILYLNLSNIVNNDELFNNMMVKYNLKELPSIVIFRNGTVYDVYNIKENNYSTDNLIAYFVSVGVIND